VGTRAAPDQRDRLTVEWRRRRLVESSFGGRLAATLARDPRYDLHELIELVERGCDPALAVRIVAPLEGTPAS
jgi:hypothetical protein